MGRPMRTLSRELVFVAGRPCDPPGCAESAGSSDFHDTDPRFGLPRQLRPCSRRNRLVAGAASYKHETRLNAYQSACPLTRPRSGYTIRQDQSDPSRTSRHRDPHTGYNVIESSFATIRHRTVCPNPSTRPHSPSLKIMASAVLFERHPFDLVVRCRTVAKVLSMALVTGMRITVPAHPAGTALVLAYGVTIRDEGHREHVSGQADAVR